MVSEEYVDFIWQSSWSEEELRRVFPDTCWQIINNYYTAFYADSSFLRPGYDTEYGYEVFPALYTPLQNESLEAANILQLQNQPVLQLKGEGVLVGMIDTGIDYTNACFRDLAGLTDVL